MKLFTVEMSSEVYNYEILPIGSMVRVDQRAYSGDKDRRELTAKVLALVPYKNSDSWSQWEKGFTHEQVYEVEYSDGQKNILFAGEASVVASEEVPHEHINFQI